MSNENITKPLSIKRKELQSKFIEAINNADLPFFIVVYILKDILNTLNNQVMQQELIEEEKYKEQLQQNSNQNNISGEQ